MSAHNNSHHSPHTTQHSRMRGMSVRYRIQNPPRVTAVRLSYRRVDDLGKSVSRDLRRTMPPSSVGGLGPNTEKRKHHSGATVHPVCVSVQFQLTRCATAGPVSRHELPTVHNAHTQPTRLSQAIRCISECYHYIGPCSLQMIGTATKPGAVPVEHGVLSSTVLTTSRQE